MQRGPLSQFLDRWKIKWAPIPLTVGAGTRTAPSPRWRGSASVAGLAPDADWRVRLVLMAQRATADDASTDDASAPGISAMSAPGPKGADAGDNPRVASSGKGDGHGSANGEEQEKSKSSAAEMAELVADHSDAVYRVALSVTRDPVLAEDVAQDALIKAWQALPSYRGEAPLRNWVLRITHNTAISALRKRREELRDPAELPERFTGASTEMQVQHNLAIARFSEALNELDETSRSIVVLREIEGLSYDEICEVLKLPLPTVKTRLLRARRQLAASLEGWRP